jgi:hypothetical protein
MKDYSMNPAERNINKNKTETRRKTKEQQVADQRT